MKIVVKAPSLFQDSIKEWYFGERYLHREDGPAIIYNNGKEEYYLNGKQTERK